MVFTIDEDLNPALFPLAWLIGRWVGNGHTSWAGGEEIEFGQQVEFATNGDSYLHYISQTWTMDAAGQPDQPLTLETGFWRPIDKEHVEVVLTHPEGWAEIWAGRIPKPGQIVMETDVVARTKTAEVEYTAGTRLYGNVEGHLMWSFDRATTTQKLQPYMWGRLARA